MDHSDIESKDSLPDLLNTEPVPIEEHRKLPINNKHSSNNPLDGNPTLNTENAAAPMQETVYKKSDIEPDVSKEEDCVQDDDNQDNSDDYQDQQDIIEEDQPGNNSDDQDLNTSSDDNSDNSSSSGNVSNADNAMEEEVPIQLHDYPENHSTYPDDQAVDFSEAFPSNRLTTEPLLVEPSELSGANQSTLSTLSPALNFSRRGPGPKNGESTEAIFNFGVGNSGIDDSGCSTNLSSQNVQNSTMIDKSPTRDGTQSSTVISKQSFTGKIDISNVYNDSTDSSEPKPNTGIIIDTNCSTAATLKVTTRCDGSSINRSEKCHTSSSVACSTPVNGNDSPLDSVRQLRTRTVLYDTQGLSQTSRKRSLTSKQSRNTRQKISSTRAVQQDLCSKSLPVPGGSVEKLPHIQRCISPVSNSLPADGLHEDLQLSRLPPDAQSLPSLTSSRPQLHMDTVLNSDVMLPTASNSSATPHWDASQIIGSQSNFAPPSQDTSVVEGLTHPHESAISTVSELVECVGAPSQNKSSKGKLANKCSMYEGSIAQSNDEQNVIESLVENLSGDKIHANMQSKVLLNSPKKENESLDPLPHLEGCGEMEASQGQKTSGANVQTFPPMSNRCARFRMPSSSSPNQAASNSKSAGENRERIGSEEEHQVESTLSGDSLDTTNAAFGVTSNDHLQFKRRRVKTTAKRMKSHISSFQFDDVRPNSSLGFTDESYSSPKQEEALSENQETAKELKIARQAKRSSSLDSSLSNNGLEAPLQDEKDEDISTGFFTSRSAANKYRHAFNSCLQDDDSDLELSTVHKINKTKMIWKRRMASVGNKSDVKNEINNSATTTLVEKNSNCKRKTDELSSSTLPLAKHPKTEGDSDISTNSSQDNELPPAGPFRPSSRHGSKSAPLVDEQPQPSTSTAANERPLPPPPPRKRRGKDLSNFVPKGKDHFISPPSSAIATAIDSDSDSDAEADSGNIANINQAGNGNDDDIIVEVDNTSSIKSRRERRSQLHFKRMKHVYRRRRFCTRDADVVDLTVDVDSGDDGDVEVLQHDKPVEYLKTESRRKKRKMGRSDHSKGGGGGGAAGSSGGGGSASAPTIDISVSDPIGPPQPINFDDPDICFGTLLEHPDRFYPPNPEADDSNSLPSASAAPGSPAFNLTGPGLLAASGPPSSFFCDQDNDSMPSTSAGKRWSSSGRSSHGFTPGEINIAAGGSKGNHNDNNDQQPSTSSGSGGSSSSSGGGGDTSRRKKERLGYILDFLYNDDNECTQTSRQGLSSPTEHITTDTAPVSPPSPYLVAPPPSCCPDFASLQDNRHLRRPLSASSRLATSSLADSLPKSYDAANPGGSVSGGAWDCSGERDGHSSGSGENNPFFPQWSARDLHTPPPTTSDGALSDRQQLPDDHRNRINLGGNGLNGRGWPSDATNSDDAEQSVSRGPRKTLLKQWFSMSSATSTGSSSSLTTAPSTSQSLASTSSSYQEPATVPKLTLVRKQSKLWEPSTSTSAFNQNSLSGRPGSGVDGDSVDRAGLSSSSSSQLVDPTLMDRDHSHLCAGASSAATHAAIQNLGSDSRETRAFQPVDNGFFYPVNSTGLRKSARSTGSAQGPSARDTSRASTSSGAGRSRHPNYFSNNMDPPTPMAFGDRDVDVDFGVGANETVVVDDDDDPVQPLTMTPFDSSAATPSYYSDNTRRLGYQGSASNFLDSILLATTPPYSVSANSNGSNAAPSGSVAGSSGSVAGSSGSVAGPSSSVAGPSSSVAGPSSSGAATERAARPQWESSAPVAADVSASRSPVEISCPICYDSLSELKEANKHLVSTVCGHLFCFECLEASVKRTKQCPTCRRKLTKRQFHKIYL